MESTALLDLRCQKTSLVEACQSARYLARKVKSVRDLLRYTGAKTASLGRRLHGLPRGSNSRINRAVLRPTFGECSPSFLLRHLPPLCAYLMSVAETRPHLVKGESDWRVGVQLPWSPPLQNVLGNADFHRARSAIAPSNTSPNLKHRPGCSIAVRAGSRRGRGKAGR